MILEMKVPSPGESITEVEIAEWLVEDGDYVEKDQAIAEVDSDKAALELPAEESGIITLKAEVGDAVGVGEIVCLIDTSAEKPVGAVANGAEELEKEEPPKKEEAPKQEVSNQPRDDESGHYFCNKDGKKVCLVGWKNITSGCLEGTALVNVLFV